MKINVKDNFLDSILIDVLYQELLYNHPHWWGHSSTPKGTSFYAADMRSEDVIPQYIFKKIKNQILNTPVELIRCYFNLQHQSMDGEFHDDDGDITSLLMLTPTPSLGGEFEYFDNNQIVQKIDYKQNRLITFDAKIIHRGLSYKINSPRITLAFKLRKL